MFFMFDSADVSEIPAHAYAVAGYVNGAYETFPKLQKAFPHAKKLSIAVNAEHDAECLDVETGDATSEQAPEWLKRQFKRGIYRPVIYIEISKADELIRLLTKNHIPRKDYRLWTAHYTYKPHVCNFKCAEGFVDVADATQFSDKALGRNLDQSWCVSTFFNKRPIIKRTASRIGSWLGFGHI